MDRLTEVMDGKTALCGCVDPLKLNKQDCLLHLRLVHHRHARSRCLWHPLEIRLRQRRRPPQASTSPGPGRCKDPDSCVGLVARLAGSACSTGSVGLVESAALGWYEDPASLLPDFPTDGSSTASEDCAVDARSFDSSKRDGRWSSTTGLSGLRKSCLGAPVIRFRGRCGAVGGVTGLAAVTTGLRVLPVLLAERTRLLLDDLLPGLQPGVCVPSRPQRCDSRGAFAPSPRRCRWGTSVA